MAQDADRSTAGGGVAPGDPDPDFAPSESQRATIKPHLRSDEAVVWEGRGIPRPFPGVRPFPAFFAAFLCTLSGFALMVLFGLYGDRHMGRGEMLFLLALSPAALICVFVVGLAGSWVRHQLWQDRIARSFYLVTDRRGIVGVDRRDGHTSFCFWTRDLFDGARGIDLGEGVGAVYFLRDGAVVAPHWGFEGIREPGRVEALIREVLLGEKPEPGPDFREL